MFSTFTRFAALLVCAALFCAGCQLKIFGLGPSLDQAVKGLSRAIGVELVMDKAPEKVLKFERFVSRGGPPVLEAIGPAKGPAAFKLSVRLTPAGRAQLGALLDVLISGWKDRAAWLASALRKLEGAKEAKGRIRLEPFTNRVVVLKVDKEAGTASLSVMTLIWEDYVSSFQPGAASSAES